MSDKENSNDRIDSFSEYFRERLKNAPTPPDENCWDEIEARLPKRRAISPVWIGLAIAASVITAVFILNVAENQNPEDYEVPELKEVIADKEMLLDETIFEEETGGDLDNIHEDIVADTKIRRKMPVISPVMSKDTTKNEVNEKDPHDEKANVEKKEEISVEEQSKGREEKKQEDSTPAQKRVDKPQQYKSLENLTAYNSDNSRRKRRGNNWQIQAGINSIGDNSGFLSNSNNIKFGMESPKFPDYETDDPHSPDIDPGDPHSPEINPGAPPTSTLPGFNKHEEYYGPVKNIPEESISDKTYSIPLSFGVTVRKKLNEKVGLETGLVYSYLSTGFTVKGPQYYNADLKLHYLGIPVNLIVNLLDKNRWNIYLSGGGMVEKGLQSVFTRSSAFLYEINSKDKSSISGLQWSVNGGVGLSYKFYKDISLYAEPGFSYYFDCDQPISKRTEDPFIFNLRVGLRYDF